MIKNTVIVTALFDIGRDTWNSFEQSYNTYLYWMNNLLSLDSNIIIYTEEKFLNSILEKRKKIDPNMKKTKIIVESFEDLEAYIKFYHKIKNLMSDEEFKKKIHFSVPEMTQPKYNTVIFNKLYFINRSIRDYDYDLYIWCDAGVLRENTYEGIVFPKVEKIDKNLHNKITFFSHDVNFKTNNRELHLLSQYRYIHGGCFFVPKTANLNFLIDYFENMVENYLEKGFVGSEEKYYDFCYEDNKEEFNIIKSDWREYFKIFG